MIRPADLKAMRARAGWSQRDLARRSRVHVQTVKYYATLRVTPAMAAGGVTDKLWEIGDIVALIEVKEAEKPMVRGPYKLMAV